MDMSLFFLPSPDFSIFVVVPRVKPHITQSERTRILHIQRDVLRETRFRYSRAQHTNIFCDWLSWSVTSALTDDDGGHRP